MNTIKKIAVIGGECTGKSTLCAALAEHFETVWVKEYAREYLETLDRQYTFEDLLLIAKGQIDAEEKAMPIAKQFLFCDTDLRVIDVWSRYKFGETDSWITTQIEKRKYDALLLTAPDLPWEYDILREHPDTNLRTYFYQLYLRIARESNLPYCLISGENEQRVNTAIDFLHAVFG